MERRDEIEICGFEKEKGVGSEELSGCRKSK